MSGILFFIFASCHPLSAQFHACDRRKRSPPFLLSDGCSTLSQTPLSNQCSSLSKIIYTTSSGVTNVAWVFDMRVNRRGGGYIFSCHVHGTGYLSTSLAVYHMTSQPVYKPDEVRRFRTQRRNVLTVSPVFDLFSLLITTMQLDEWFISRNH